MKKLTASLLSALALGVLISGCSPLQPVASPTASKTPAPLVKTQQVQPELAKKASAQRMKAAVKALEVYSSTLYRAVAKSSEGNLVLSPLGAFTLSQVLVEGSQGVTRQKLAKTLARSGYGLEEVAQLHWSLSSSPALVLREGVFVEQTTGLNPSFAAKVGPALNADIKLVPFSSSSAEAVSQLNSWVEEATQGRYSNLALTPAPQTKLMMISTLFFQGRWSSPFSPEMTSQQPFTLTNGQKIQVLMMELTEFHSVPMVKAVKGDGVVLRFEEGAELVLLLPHPGVAPDSLLEDLRFQKVEDWSPVTVHLPRFEFDAPTMELPFEALGFGPLLAPSDLAPLLAQPGSEPLEVEAVQRAKIRVDEEGAEAAAVTEILASPTAAFSPSPPKVIRFDRPFAFVLRDSESQAILLMGRVENPTGG